MSSWEEANGTNTHSKWLKVSVNPFPDSEAIHHFAKWNTKNSKHFQNYYEPGIYSVPKKAKYICIYLIKRMHYLAGYQKHLLNKTRSFCFISSTTLMQLTTKKKAYNAYVSYRNNYIKDSKWK